MSKKKQGTAQQPTGATSDEQNQQRLRNGEGSAPVAANSQIQASDIAIIGMSCRFPGADDWHTLWENVKAGVDSVVDIPEGRWPAQETWYHPEPAHPNTAYIRCGGFLERVDEFDAPFFKIPPVEAQLMDPQQRIFLEEAYHAIEDAGLAPEQLKGQQCGIFVGVGQSGYTLVLAEAGLLQSRYAITGLDVSTLAARIAYFLDLHGPAIALNTACSSSLLAVHQACESIRSGEIDLALAGGVTVYATPLFHVQASQFKMLSAEGRCKAFDASANGFVPSEGCGVLLLKNAAKALADGDPIYAVIKGSGVNQDGSTNGITAPSARAQTRLEKTVYERFAINPATIGYVEAHGTGTALGDPIEISALTESFADYTQQKQFCAIGSIKTNLGHTIQAAGAAGVIKAALCVQTGELPPSLHYTQPNPHINFAQTPFYVNTQHQTWPAPSDHPRRAAVSAFGISGTNAHLILEAPPVTDVQTAEDRAAHLLTIAAKSESALQAYARRYAEFLTEHPAVDLGDLCYTSHVGRTHFAHRLSLVFDSPASLQQQLTAFSDGKSAVGRSQGVIPPSQAAPALAFLFTGQGAQYVGMGRELYQTSPTFRAALDRCDELLQQETGESLLAILYPQAAESETATRHSLDDTTYTQPALFALEYALVKLWQAWGITPDVLLGHSVGEVVAACVAGVFSLEDGLKLIAARGRLMGALPQDGEMVALQASEEQVSAALAPYAASVSIAALNGAESVVISGKREAVLVLAEQFAAQGVKARKLTVSHAFHSPLMEPMLADFRKVVQSITYHAPKLRLISNLTGKVAGAEVATPEYWVRHVRQAVRFADGVATLQELGISTWLEIGPKPVLMGMAQSIVESAPRPPLLLRSLHHKQSDWQALLGSLGELYVRGAAINWQSFDQDYVRRKVALPTYPFQRKRFWVTDEQAPKRDRLTDNDATVPSKVQGAATQPVNGVAPVVQSTDGIALTSSSAPVQSAPVENDMILTSQTTELDEAADSGSKPLPNDEFQTLDQLESDGMTLEIAEVKGFHFSIQLGGEQA